MIELINRNTLDNRRCNLRATTYSQNTYNGPRVRVTNTSGVTGVVRSGKKWVAQIGSSYKNINLGRFDSFEDAVAARKAAERLYIEK